MSLKQAELLHVITVNLLENIKLGIYVTDPIPNQSFVSRLKGMLCFVLIVVTQRTTFT